MNSPLLSPAVGEQIKWQVIAGGGGRSTSASYVLSGTIGQTAAGPGTSASYKLNSGFWQNFDNGSGCCDVAGDADNGGDVNIGDVTFLIAYIFSGGAAPVCTREADADAGGDISIGDAVYLIAYIFQGGPAPICGP